MSHHLKYSVISIESNGAKGHEKLWSVKYYVWQGCACNKIKRVGTIAKATIPTLSDVHYLESTMPPYKIPGSKVTTN